MAREIPGDAPMKITVLMPAVLAAAGIACAPLAQADGDASNLDQLVAQVYNQVQTRCTPPTPPSFQRIAWDNGRPTGLGGTGRIIDANPALGGPFTAWWSPTPNATPGARVVPALGGNSYWQITLQFC